MGTSNFFFFQAALRHPFFLVADEVISDFPGFETTDPYDFDSVILGLPCSMIDYRLLTKAIE
jgi:hypothetical protein